MTCIGTYLASNHERYVCERVRLHEGACWRLLGNRLLVWGILPKGLR